MTLDLEALKRVAEAATPGPWEVSDADVRTSAFVRARGFGHVCNTPVPIHDWYEREANRESQARKNIAHIATFDPPTVLALIARLEAAEKKAVELGTYCREAADGFAGIEQGLEAAARWHLEQAAKIRRERARAKARLTDAEATDLECWAHRHELHAESIRALAAGKGGR